MVAIAVTRPRSRRAPLLGSEEAGDAFGGSPEARPRRRLTPEEEELLKEKLRRRKFAADGSGIIQYANKGYRRGGYVK